MVQILGELAKLVGVNLDEARALRAAEDASRKVRLQDLRKQGDDIDPHRRDQQWAGLGSSPDGDSLLLEQTGHRLARNGSEPKPVPDPLFVQFQLLLGFLVLRVVRAEFLEQHARRAGSATPSRSIGRTSDACVPCASVAT